MSPDCDSSLERLPPEVRRYLLSLLDLSQLKALVHASPTFHQQYLLDRRFLLRSSLGVTLGFARTDARVVQPVERNAEDEIVSFYFQPVLPIARRFAAWALDELERQTGQAQPESTSTEWQRCLRTTYHFQLLCRLANRPDLTQLGRSDIVKSFFYCLEPWEVEGLFSFYQFVQGVYDRVFDDIRDDVHPDNPRFADQDHPPTPDGAFEFDESWQRANFIEGTALHGGLELLYTVLFSSDRELLISTMQCSIRSSYIPINSTTGILGETEQAQRRQQSPSPGDQMTEERAPFPFVGDDLDKPPLAWILIWGGTYSNLYGWYTSDEMRRWAYVIWDAKRLEEYDGKDVLERQWEECWEGDDPRDMLD